MFALAALLLVMAYLVHHLRQRIAELRNFKKISKSNKELRKACLTENR
jgi:hypothetical protein